MLPSWSCLWKEFKKMTNWGHDSQVNNRHWLGAPCCSASQLNLWKNKWSALDLTLTPSETWGNERRVCKALLQILHQQKLERQLLDPGTSLDNIPFAAVTWLGQLISNLQNEGRPSFTQGPASVDLTISASLGLLLFGWVTCFPKSLFLIVLSDAF